LPNLEEDLVEVAKEVVDGGGGAQAIADIENEKLILRADTIQKTQISQLLVFWFFEYFWSFWLF
jgi:hypothetical protein